MKWYLRILPFLVLSACGQQQSADQTTNGQTPLPSAETQAKIDENIIVNYAMENFLNVRKTPSGLYYEILAEGQGNTLYVGDHILIHYRGTFHNAVEFDNSYNRNQPMKCYVGKMIAGWNEGLQFARIGGKIRLLVPSALGYGTTGLKEGDKTIVPPNAVLIFDIEVLEML